MPHGFWRSIWLIFSGLAKRLLLVGGLMGMYGVTNADDVKDPGVVFDSLIMKQRLEGHETVELEWHYTNRGTFPAVVEKLSEDCGCLRGILDQTPVAPSKRGTIRASLEVGVLRGLVRKPLRVYFAGYDTSFELIAEVLVPNSVEMSPQQLTWVAGESDVFKILEVKAGTSTDIRVTQVSEISGFVVSPVETVKEGRHYRIRIRPRNINKSRSGVLQIRTSSPDARDQMKLAFVNVEAESKTGVRSGH